MKGINSVAFTVLATLGGCNGLQETFVCGTDTVRVAGTDSSHIIPASSVGLDCPKGEAEVGIAEARAMLEPCLGDVVFFCDYPERPFDPDTHDDVTFCVPLECEGLELYSN